jgi:hypothetical protein
MEGLVDRNKLGEMMAPFSELQTRDIETGNVPVHFGFEEERGEGTLDIGGTELRIGDRLLCDAARVVGIPETYYRKTPTSLMTPHLDFWYNKGGFGNVRFFTKEDTVVGVTKRLVANTYPDQIMGMIETQLDKDRIIGFHKPHFSLDFVKIPMVFADEKSVGTNGSKDPFRAGIYFQTSISGANPLCMAAYFLRQVCTNGSVVSKDIMKWSRKNVTYGMDVWVKDALDALMPTFDKEFESIKRLREVKVSGHVAEALDSIFHDLNIPNTVAKLVQDEIIDSGADTLYDVFNAVTRVATHSELMDDRPLLSHRMMTAAGQITEHPIVCEACHRVM